MRDVPIEEPSSFRCPQSEVRYFYLFVNHGVVIEVTTDFAAREAAPRQLNPGVARNLCKQLSYVLHAHLAAFETTDVPEIRFTNAPLVHGQVETGYADACGLNGQLTFPCRLEMFVTIVEFVREDQNPMRIMNAKCRNCVALHLFLRRRQTNVSTIKVELL